MFRWQQMVDTPSGKRVVDYEGRLPPSVEDAAARLIAVAKRLALDVDRLQAQVEVLQAQVATPSKRADVMAPQSTVSSRRGKGA